MKKELLSTSAAAAFLGVCERTIRNWEAKGKLVSTPTIGGHRRFAVSSLKHLVPQTELESLERRGITPYQVFVEHKLFIIVLFFQLHYIAEFHREHNYIIEIIKSDR